jgi:solute:Na+ symporter, SSS family
LFSLPFFVLIYLLVIGYLGFLGYKRTENAVDYLVAGRDVHPYVMALSYGATFISTSAIVGFGGVAGLFGMGLLWLVFLNIFVGILIAFIVFGNRTRLMGYRLKAHTFPELLGKRYQSKFIQIFSGIVLFTGMSLYAGVVLIGGVRFIEVYMGFPYLASLWIFSVIIAAYVIAGGLKGVMYTDALQGTIMFAGMLILLVFTYIKLNGVSSAHQALTDLASRVPENLAAAGHKGWTSMPETGSNWWWTLVSTIILGVGIGVLAQPQLVVRFMTVKSRMELNRAVLIGGIFVLITTGVAYVVGSLSNVYFDRTEGVISIAAAQGNVDTIIPLYIAKAMPEWFGVIFMLTLLSAAMSTLSSQLHAMGTAISRDIYQQLVPRRGKGNTVLLTRLAILAGIIIVIWLGWVLPPGIIARGTAIFFGLCASTFLPMYALGLFWRRVTPAAAKTGLIFGFLGSLFYLLFILEKEAKAMGLCKLLTGEDSLAPFPWTVVDPILVIFPLTCIITVVVSLFTRGCGDEHLKKCFH